MTDVVIDSRDVVIETPQPTVPANIAPVKIGLVEIDQIVQRGSMWFTGSGAPVDPGGQVGDMYLDVDTGDIYQWTGSAWQYEGTFAPTTLTAEEILAMLLTVDGAGSALDADLLDGQHGAYYADAAGLATEKGRNDAQDVSISNNAAGISALNTSVSNLQTDVTALEADTTAAATLTKIKTVDGAGSGLDADLLDGRDSAYFAPIDSPLFTGDARAQTPAANDNDLSIATTAWVTAKGYVPEAPNDGVQYVRKSLAWAPVSVPPGTYVSDTPPPSPSDNQMWWKSNTGVLYLYYNDGNTRQWVQLSASPQIVDQNYTRKTANRKNAVVNPAMQVSQQNGTTASTTSNYYLADQWIGSYVGGTVSWQTIALPTPKGSPNRLSATVTAGKASLAAGDYCQLRQIIEGARVADLQWGTVNAKQALLRFGFRGPAGTYSAKIANMAANRIYLANFTITAAQANTDTEQVIIIPGDTTGTWPVGNAGGLVVTFVFATGTTYGAGVAGWQSANMIGTPANTNGIATTGNTFHIFDVGLHVDPDATCLAPTFEVPDYTDELARCQRYWALSDLVGYQAYAGASTTFEERQFFPVTMRAPPTVGLTGGAINNASAIGINRVSTDGAGLACIVSGTGAFYAVNYTMTMDARM